MEGVQKFGRALLLSLGGLLGVDVATDVVVDEKNDVIEIAEPVSSLPSPSIAPTISTSPSSRSIPKQTDESRSRSGITTAAKAVAFSLAVLIGAFGAPGRLASNLQGLRTPQERQSTVFREAEELRSQFFVSVPVRLPHETPFIDDQPGLVGAFSSLEQDLIFLLAREFPPKLARLLHVEALDFGADGEFLLVNIRITVPNLGALSDLCDTLSKAVYDRCVRLFTEKLGAIALTHAKDPDKPLRPIVKGVVANQLKDQNWRPDLEG